MLWAIDYDTAARVNSATWQVTAQARLQDAISGTRLCTLEITQRIPAGGQPLDAARLSSGQIVARDWQTGTRLTAANQDH